MPHHGGSRRGLKAGHALIPPRLGLPAPSSRPPPAHRPAARARGPAVPGRLSQVSSTVETVITTLAVENYRSLRDLCIPVGPLTVVTGIPGQGLLDSPLWFWPKR